MIKRLAFLIGLSLGLVSIVQASTAILTYFLTGKLTAIEVQETDGGRRPVFKLISPSDVWEIIKDQAAKGRIQIHFGEIPSEPEQEANDAS